MLHLESDGNSPSEQSLRPSLRNHRQGLMWLNLFYVAPNARISAPSIANAPAAIMLYDSGYAANMATRRVGGEGKHSAGRLVTWVSVLSSRHGGRRGRVFLGSLLEVF